MLKLCGAHNELLIVELFKRGLTRFIGDTPEENHSRAQNIIASNSITKENFEPMFLAGLAIHQNTANMGGVITSEAGESCPICADPENRLDWLSFAADEVDKLAQQLGFGAEEADVHEEPGTDREAPKLN